MFTSKSCGLHHHSLLRHRAARRTYMVVVGMLHMMGDEGVVPLLEKEGFTVERQ
ncbi:TraB/GumN family protein [Paenibacillus sp. RC67]|uniref:TraB/GumN family protein n=1 Tax=Paenibacillus sp. RC67 TaxID=3039392 RepID=UPI0024ADA5FA|nr:TraB/GumN family protein [Paenibacillus sp. RC67]